MYFCLIYSYSTPNLCSLVMPQLWLPNLTLMGDTLTNIIKQQKQEEINKQIFK
jgi:hypothetical protein